MGLENPLHIAVLLVILLLVFGAKRLPEMGRSLGGGLRGFKDSLEGAGNHMDELPAHRPQSVARSAASAPEQPVGTAATVGRDPVAVPVAPPVESR